MARNTGIYVNFNVKIKHARIGIWGMPREVFTMQLLFRGNDTIEMGPCSY
jgi:hypothetical protein